jgi:hypothetical protein
VKPAFREFIRVPILGTSVGNNLMSVRDINNNDKVSRVFNTRRTTATKSTRIDKMLVVPLPDNSHRLVHITTKSTTSTCCTYSSSSSG